MLMLIFYQLTSHVSATIQRRFTAIMCYNCMFFGRGVVLWDSLLKKTPDNPRKQLVSAAYSLNIFNG
jgi:hypothetical protein